MGGMKWIQANIWCDGKCKSAERNSLPVPFFFFCFLVLGFFSGFVYEIRRYQFWFLRSDRCMFSMREKILCSILFTLERVIASFFIRWFVLPFRSWWEILSVRSHSRHSPCRYCTPSACGADLLPVARGVLRGGPNHINATIPFRTWYHFFFFFKSL